MSITLSVRPGCPRMTLPLAAMLIDRDRGRIPKGIRCLLIEGKRLWSADPRRPLRGEPGELGFEVEGVCYRSLDDIERHDAMAFGGD